MLPRSRLRRLSAVTTSRCSTARLPRTADAFAALAKETGCAIGVKGKNLSDLVELVNKLIAAGVKDMVH